MKRLQLNGRKLVFVPIPEGEDVADIARTADTADLEYHGTTQTITEEQARVLVERFSHATWRNYECAPQYLQYLMRSAADSFASFLRVHHIVGNHAILEEQ